MVDRVAAARAAVSTVPGAPRFAAGMPLRLGLGDPTQIVWAIRPTGIGGAYQAAKSSGGGGGGLPTGWTQDSADPANVFTHGEGAGGTGSLIVGDEVGESVEIDSSGLNAVDEDGNQWLVTQTSIGLILTPKLSGGAAITIDSSQGATEALRAGSLIITEVADPGNPQDAATKAYVDASVIPPDLDGVLATGNDAGTQSIINMADPTDPQDAATKAYVDAATPSLSLAQVLAVGDDANAGPITNLADPSDPQDAATKAYVDTHAGGGGAYVLLDTVILEAPTPGSFDVSGIDQSYQDLIVVCRIIGDGTVDYDDLHLYFNGDETAGNYMGNMTYSTGSPNTSDFAAASVICLFAGDQFSVVTIAIEGYSTGGLWKQQALSQWGLVQGTSRRSGINWFQWNDTDAVTEIALVPFTYPLGAGSRMDIYGRGTK